MITGSGGTFCTGAAIARDLVLSAAHCVLPGADYKLIEFNAARQPVLLDIRQIARHPNFNLQTLLGHRATADVALLKLAAPLPADIQPAVLDRADRKPQPGDRYSVTGYGLAVRGDGKTGGTLRTAQLVATGKPGNLQIRLVDPATGGNAPGLGACTGDSGAPVYEGTALAGVVSWSTGPNMTAGCGGLTGVTPLTLYRGWIVDTARKLGSPLAPP
jgi:secreted trypsin-like serine protease